MDETKSNVATDSGSPFPSFIALRAEHSELLQREPDTEHEKEQCLKEVEEFIKRVQATGAILSDDEERRSGQNILNYWVSTLYRQDQVARLITLADYERDWSTEVTDVACPYPGVRAFSEQDAPFFFGRQRQIDYMVGRLKEDRLLVIVGESGSGKTSLVQAGLLPALKKEQPKELEHFFFPPIVPGSDPLTSLALTIKRAKNSGEDDPGWLRQQIQHFQEDTGHLLKLIEEITDKAAVIFIDQGEELYERSVPKLLRPFENLLDFDNSRKTIEPLLDNLISVVKSPGRRHIVIIARRIGDYEPRFNRLPSRVKEVFEPARVVLPALYASELRDAIQKPAELLGFKFEEADLQDVNVLDSSSGITPKETTVQALVKQVSSEPVGLPLMQFVLPGLWEKRDGNKIPDQAFREMGSCRAALTNTAEQFYSSLSFADRRLCRRLLTQLITLDRELKPHVYPVRRAVLRRAGNQSRVDDLLEMLARQQLVRVSQGGISGDDWLELVHDSLVSDWPTMSSWIEGKRSRRRQLQALNVVGIAAGLALLILAGFLVKGWQEQKNKSRELARLSNKHATSDRFDLALRLGEEAYTLEDNASTRGNLLSLLHALQSPSHPTAFFHQNNFEAEDVVFSAENDGSPSRLAAIDEDGNIVIWNLNSPGSGKTLGGQNAGQTARYPLAFSPDGNRLATGSASPGSVILWEIASGTASQLAQAEKPFLITTLVFSTDNKSLITGNEVGSVVQWDLANESAKDLYQHSRAVNSLAFHPKRNMLGSGSDDGTAICWDFEARRNPRKTFAAGGEVKDDKSKSEFKRIVSVAFSADSELLAAGSDDEAFVWNLTSGKQLSEFDTDAWSSGMLVSLSADGSRLACFSFESGIFVYNVPEHEIQPRQLLRQTWTHSAAFSNDGKLLALPGEHGVSVWEVFSEHRLFAEGNVSTIAFSPNARVIASGGDDNTLTLWKTPSPNGSEMLGEPIKESSAISSLAFSGDGKLLAAGLQNGRISLRDPQNYQTVRILDVKTGKLIGGKDSPAAPEAAGLDAEEDENESGTPMYDYSVSKVVFDPQPSSRRLAAIVKTERVDTQVKDDENNLGSRIIIWDTNNESLAEDLQNLGRVTSLAFGYYDSTLAWGSTKEEITNSPGNAKFRVILRNANIGQIELPVNHEVRSLAFTNDGEILAAGLANGEIVRWKMTTRQQTGNLLIESSGEVTNLVFSPDGKTLAAAMNKTLRHSPAGEIVLWDVKTSSRIGNTPRRPEGRVSAIAFSCDGKILASGSQDDSRIDLWDFDLAGAGYGFCKEKDCRRPLPESESELLEQSLFQKVYAKYLTWLDWLTQDQGRCCNCAPDS